MRPSVCAFWTASGGDSNPQPSVPKTDVGNQQVLENTAFTENQVNGLADCLAEVVQQWSDLARLIEAWPDLPADTKATILRIAGVL